MYRDTKLWFDMVDIYSEGRKSVLSGPKITLLEQKLGLSIGKKY